MQQTEKYKLNLIESSDPFLPEGLNQNTQKIEDVLVERMEGSLNAMQSQVDAIAKNLGVGGKNCRIAWGSYKGTGESGKDHPNSLTFDFYPVFIMIGSNRCFTKEPGPSLILRGINTVHGDYDYLSFSNITWRDNGIDWYGNSYNGQNNSSTSTYYFLAIGIDPNS